MNITRTRSLAVAASAMALLALSLSACSTSTPRTAAVVATAKPTGYTVVTPATIKPGDPVPAPTGRVVLTLKGVTNTNVGNTLQFDLPTLEKLGTVEYSVFDRQALGRDVTFSGPLVRTVLAVAGAHGSTMHTVALNDYAVDIPTGDTTTFPVLLATRADGQAMSVAHYGPTRFIYPTKGYHLDKTVYDPRWIWQLSVIEMR